MYGKSGGKGKKPKQTQTKKNREEKQADSQPVVSQQEQAGMSWLEDKMPFILQLIHEAQDQEDPDNMVIPIGLLDEPDCNYADLLVKNNYVKQATMKPDGIHCILY
jgi:hypothetical protein